MKSAALVVGLGLTLLSPAAGQIRLGKGPPLPAPDPERGAIALSVKVSRGSAEQVYFVRLEDEAVLAEAEQVIPSNHSRQEQVFLLNAKPGRYVVVAAQRYDATRGYTFKGFLSLADIARTEVSVEPGEMTFMGELRTKGADKIGMKHADAAQSHYLRLIDPNAARQGGFMSAWSRRNAIHMVDLEELERDTDCEQRFWARAIDKAFKREAQWRELVATRLATLAEARAG